jgi:hypothetical protein
MASRFFIFIPLIILLPDIYIWFCYVCKLKSRWRYLHWLPLLYLLVVIVAMMTSIRIEMSLQLLLIMIILLYVPKLVFVVVSAAGRLCSLFVRRAARAADKMAALLSSLTLCCMLYGLIFGWRQITVREVTIISDRLPAAFDGYRIAQISDLHVGTFSRHPKFIGDVVRAVNATKPDAIFFTGDIVNMRSNELNMFVDTLSRLSAPDGVFSIMGNHDYCEYGSESKEASIRQTELLVQMEMGMGWDLLLNTHRMLRRGNDCIALIGVENDGEPPFSSYSDLPGAMRGVPADCYKILLSHNPTHWRREVLGGSDVDLTLAGHTHAMQFRIGRFSPSMFKYREWGGLYSEDDRSLYVNTGTGGNFLFRFGAFPEITLITLKRR